MAEDEEALVDDTQTMMGIPNELVAAGQRRHASRPPVPPDEPVHLRGHTVGRWRLIMDAPAVIGAGHHLHGLGMLSISARDRQGRASAHQHPVPRPQRCVIQWRIKGVVESHQHLGHWLAGLPGQSTEYFW